MQPSVRSLAVTIAVTALLACADQPPLGPEAGSTPPAHFAAAPEANGKAREPALGSCQNLQVGDDSKLAFRVFASGVQIYRWSGTAWTFVAPEATLYAGAGEHGEVGNHYAGPTWESNSGSKVVGTVIERCTTSASDIQWLLLGRVSSEGPGIFQRVRFIQRLNTSGGIAPTTPGTVVGELARVPYTTDYFFYR